MASQRARNRSAPSMALLRQGSRQGDWLLILALVSACGGSSLVSIVTGDPGRERWLSSLPAYHLIRPGETLYSIAWQYGKDYRDLAKWNDITKPYWIYAGQRLYLTPPVRSQGLPAVKTKTNDRQGGLKAGIQWQWPAAGKLLQSDTEFGRQGLEIQGREGQPVKAAASGSVVYSGDGLRGDGKLVIIKHSPIYLSAYAHNKRLLVREGKRVFAGQQIAEMGRSGNRQVKLYFEIRCNGRPVPPLQYLPDAMSN